MRNFSIHYFAQKSNCLAVGKNCEKITNIYGYVHGGAFFTMADCCAGLTARSDGRQYVTQNASVNFIHNIKAGHLTARGRTVSRRRHICVVAVEITDETDTLLFSSTFSMYCISAEG